MKGPLAANKNSWIDRFGLPAILLITALVLLGALFNGFTNWDDNTYILNNHLIKRFSWDSVYTIMFSYTGLGGTRLTLLNFLLDYYLFGLAPFPYHLANLLLHLCNVALVFYVVRRLFSRADVALLTALLFGIHPMHVESVAWISERKDVLYTCLFLLSLLSYQHYLKNTRKYLWLALTFALFFLSWHAKLSAACLPVVLLLFDYYYRRKFSWKLVLEKLPFFAYVIVLTSKIFMFHERTGGDFHHLTQTFTFFDRLLMAGYSVAFYLLKMIAPFKISAIYPYPQKADGSLPLIYFIASGAMIIILVFMIWGIVKFKKIRREMIFGLLFFFITIAMFSHIIPIKGVVVTADRYTYVPYIGLFALISFLIIRFIGSIRIKKLMKRLSIAVLILLLLMYAGLSINRTLVWKNSITLFTDVIKKNPEVEYAYNNRGIARKDGGDLQGAIADFDQAILLNPGFPYSYSNRGIARSLSGDFKGAVEDLNMALLLKSDYFEAYFNRALVKKYLKDWDGVMADLDATIKYKKGFAPAYYERAQEWYRRANLTSALADVNRALQLKRSYPDAYYVRGNIRKDRHEFDAAIADYSEAIRIYPEFAEAFNNRAFVKNATGDYNGALADLNKALDINPEIPDAHNNKGISLANLQKMQESVVEFDKAIELRPDYSEAYNNRGNARAFLGDFDGSVADFNKVLLLNPSDTLAMMNRGNARFSMNDLQGACDDWHRAWQMGFAPAEDMVKHYCR